MTAVTCAKSAGPLGEGWPPGALMNTAGSGNDFVGSTNGYGNVEFNGLPALSNGYIVDGLETMETVATHDRSYRSNTMPPSLARVE